jgi:hypothetical protein
MSASPQEPAPIRVIDVKMPFGSMVVFMVKWSLAAIPALIILTVFALLVASVLYGLGLHK